MLEFRKVEFAPESGAVKPSFSDFIKRALNANKIGPENSARLLKHWPKTFDTPGSEKIKPRLAEISSKQDFDNEVIAPALRTGEDFSVDEVVVFKPPERSSSWNKGRVKDVSNGFVVVGEDILTQITMPAFYTALFRPWEEGVMTTEKPRTGHLSLARFVVMLSYFDVRMAGHDDLIRNTARHMGTNPVV